MHIGSQGWLDTSEVTPLVENHLLMLRAGSRLHRECGVKARTSTQVLTVVKKQ